MIGNLLLQATDIQLGCFDDIEDLCLNIFLVDDIIPMAFIINETDDYLVIVRTTENGSEKISLLAKDSITRIDLCYIDDFEAPAEPKPDKMIN